MKSIDVLEKMGEELLIDFLKLTLPPAGYVLSGLRKEKQDSIVEANFEKEREKIYKLLIDIQKNMNELDLKTLRNFNQISFSLEIHSVIQEIIEEGIHAKGIYLRKIIANSITYIGSADDPKDLHGKALCLELIRQLNEIDVQLLLIYHLSLQRRRCKTSDEELQKSIESILKENTIHEQQLHISTKKLFTLGLVVNETPRGRKMNNKSAKEDQIDLFISRNNEECGKTFYYETFIRYIRLFQ